MGFGDYKNPAVTVDLVVFSIVNGSLCVLLNKREEEPAKGEWAIPGGFVKIDEELEEEEL